MDSIESSILENVSVFRSSMDTKRIFHLPRFTETRRSSSGEALLMATWLKPPRLVLVTLTVPVAELTCHIKKDLSEAATSCMTDIGNRTGNIHFEPFLPLRTKHILKSS